MNSFQLIIFTLFWLALSFQLFFYLYLIWWLQKIQNKKPDHDKPVSVIIAAHNEEKNIPKLISALETQRHHIFEVIIINDRSTDGTKRILDDLNSVKCDLKVIHIDHAPEGYSPKKYALAKGIEAAKHDTLLFTDADCVPQTNNWISAMAAHISADSEIVIGYSPLKCPNTLTGLLIRFETFLTAFRYLALANAGKTYMAVGRNLAYSRSVFQKNSGFESHKHILSGDDDLFIQQNATPDNTSVVIYSESQTISDSPKNLKSWFRQKKRHLKTGLHYPLSTRLLLGIEVMSTPIIYLGLLYSVVSGYVIWYTMVAFLLRTLLLFTTFTRAQTLLGGKSTWLAALFLIEPLFMIFYFITGMSTLATKEDRWK